LLARATGAQGSTLALVHCPLHLLARLLTVLLTTGFFSGCHGIGSSSQASAGPHELDGRRKSRTLISWQESSCAGSGGRALLPREDAVDPDGVNARGGQRWVAEVCDVAHGLGVEQDEVGEGSFAN